MDRDWRRRRPRMGRATRRRRTVAALGTLVASGCVPPPVDCEELLGRRDTDCMTRCLSCGAKDHGPCRAVCQRDEGRPTGVGTATAPLGDDPRLDSARPGGSPASKADAAAVVAPDGGAEPAPEATPAASSAARADEPRFTNTRFPPPDFEPPSKVSASPGDGQWSRFGDASRGDRAGSDPAVFYQTVVHPHPVSRFLAVHVVAIDLRAAALHFAAGTDDPGANRLGSAQPPGLVPERHRDDVLAVFNGGFLPRHGRWGMMIGGHVLLPPREQGCTVAIAHDGTVRIAPWPAIAPVAEELAAFRQTPSCLLHDGTLDPLLEAGNERPWGGRDPKRKTRRRSALGIDATGRVLLYGFGVEVGPRMMALGMRYAGAAAAAQLDINWSWVKFLLLGRPSPDAPLQVTTTLVPKMVHARRGYVERTAFRDFFYVTRR